MPIMIPNNLPARPVLEKEGVMVMSERTALRQDIRPLQIGLLNLMPNKVRTETQFARLVGATPLQVALTLVRITDHVPRNTSPEHMEAFYQPWEEVRARKFDGFIITGAPIETLDFHQVSYWNELRAILDWTQAHVHSSLAICWGAQAAMQHFFGLPKYTLADKAFGVFRHRNLAPASPYLRGFSDDFSIPVSRWTQVRAQDMELGDDLQLLIDSVQTGPCLLYDRTHNFLYMFNHIEYDSADLANEYRRDIRAGTPITLPKNYFPDDDPDQPPENRWRSHAHLLFGNWINEMYQSTPYDLNLIGRHG